MFRAKTVATDVYRFLHFAIKIWDQEWFVSTYKIETNQKKTKLNFKFQIDQNPQADLGSS